MKHGTLGGYAKGRCRCDECVAVWRTYQREWQRGLRARRAAGWKRGYLEVTCWCETAVVYVAPETLRDGRTESCGRSHCRPGALRVIDTDPADDATRKPA